MLLLDPYSTVTKATQQEAEGQEMVGGVNISKTTHENVTWKLNFCALIFKILI